LANTEDDDGLGAEVASRLDEMFAEEEEPAYGNNGRKEQPEEKAAQNAAVTEAAGADSTIAREVSGISNLKALVSEIEWEITDTTMRGFLNEIDNLKQKHSKDQVLLMYLRLHESIGKYIKARKVRAHPEAIKFVSSVFNSFEKVLGTPDMPLMQKKNLLAEEMKIFKNLKQKLTSRKEIDTRPGMPEKAMPAMPMKVENQEALDYIAEYIFRKVKTLIKEEFEAMKRILEKR
jgi:hypothetical protein